MKVKFARSAALAIALEKYEILKPRCQRIEIAGSLRRRKREVGDIEIVAIPHFESDMFGNATADHSLNYFPWKDWGVLELNGPKQKKIMLFEGIQLDLFIVTPPAQWGWILLLRTGPDTYSKKMVTHKNKYGFMPGHLCSDEGRILDGKTPVPTPEEVDVYNLFNMPYLLPECRK